MAHRNSRYRTKSSITRHFHNRQSINMKQFCLRCFEFGHRRENQCTNDPIVACGVCCRTNFFTRDCPCSKQNQDGMTLRLSDGPTPKPYIDITISSNIYPALLSTSIFYCRIIQIGLYRTTQV